MEINTDKLYGKLGFCGCTKDEITEVFQIVINDLLEARKNNTSYFYTEIAERNNLDKRLVELILLELDRLNITEHGTSIRGSWCHNATDLEKLVGEPTEEELYGY